MSGPKKSTHWTDGRSPVTITPVPEIKKRGRQPVPATPAPAPSKPASTGSTSGSATKLGGPGSNSPAAGAKVSSKGHHIEELHGGRQVMAMTRITNEAVVEKL